MSLRILAACAVLVTIGCSGGDGEEAAPPVSQTTTTAAASVAPPPTGPIDQALATRGEQLFQSKGCIGCHTIGGGRLTGPDLQAVTTRREYGWIMAMIINPDSMLKADATARQLFAEYMTPMMNMGVTPEEARAIYEHLRRAAGAN